MTAQDRFEALQARWRKAQEATREFSWQLEYKYGETWLAPRGKRDRLDRLRKREGEARDDIFAWLDDNSPRSWRSGVPCQWVCNSLTYADAITSGHLSEIPAVTYGCMPGDSARFAAPVAQRMAMGW